MDNEKDDPYASIKGRQVKDDDFDKEWLLLTDLSVRRFSKIPSDFFEKKFGTFKPKVRPASVSVSSEMSETV